MYSFSDDELIEVSEEISHFFSLSKNDAIETQAVKGFCPLYLAITWLEEKAELDDGDGCLLIRNWFNSSKVTVREFSPISMRNQRAIHLDWEGSISTVRTMPYSDAIGLLPNTTRLSGIHFNLLFRRWIIETEEADEENFGLSRKTPNRLWQSMFLVSWADVASQYHSDYGKPLKPIPEKVEKKSLDRRLAMANYLVICPNAPREPKQLTEFMHRYYAHKKVDQAKSKDAYRRDANYVLSNLEEVQAFVVCFPESGPLNQLVSASIKELKNGQES